MTLFFAGAWAISMTVAATAAALSAHRAVYDLNLARAEPASGVAGMSGRLVFEFRGDSCTGYVVNMRWVNQVVEEDGTAAVSDLRSSTWEAGDGGAFGFSTTQYMDSGNGETTRGKAYRPSGGPVAVKLDAPERKTVSFTGDVAFPTEHMRALIAAAGAGRRVLQMRLFDGSESGDKVYETTAVIGAAAKPRHQNAAARRAGELKGLSTWPVTIAYFDAEDDRSGEARPVYKFSFDLYENGVSDSLLLDYGDYALEGRMRQIEFLPEAECK
ncbi:MAG: cell envelope integrity EipB family protein [Hyphomicrobiales bacterium]|nr:cell envelope integrity EipB family protein [Hyphomicrobiales bacterium]